MVQNLFADHFFYAKCISPVSLICCNGVPIERMNIGEHVISDLIGTTYTNIYNNYFDFK